VSPREVQEGYCPTCRTRSLLSYSGACVWCDTQVATREEPRKKKANAGIPVLMQDDVLEDARRIYETGRSLRSIAAELLPRTDYASARSLAAALSEQFRHRGWPVRGRIEQTVIASTKHGYLRRDNRNPSYVRAQKIARGEIANRRCQGVRLAYPKKGQPCSAWAVTGSDYCYQHDPATRERVVAICAQMRETRAAA
jgi:hypothetical protein